MSHAARRELAYRSQNGLEVTLLWDPRSNEVSVEVIDHSTTAASGSRSPATWPWTRSTTPMRTRSRTTTTATDLPHTISAE